MSNHIQEIIKICLPLDYDDFNNNKDFNWEDSARSFLLFTKAPPSLLEALFQNDAIYTQMSLIFIKIRNGHNPPFFLVSRISSILAFIISNITKEVTNCIGFIYQLLPFKKDHGVFDLFIQMCSLDTSFEPMQKALVESHFSEHIILEINKRQQYIIRSNNKKTQKSSSSSLQICDQKIIPQSESDLSKPDHPNELSSEENDQTSESLNSQTPENDKKSDIQNEITLEELKNDSHLDESNSKEVIIDSSQFMSNESMYFIYEDDDPSHELHISLLLQIIRLCNLNKILKESFSSNKVIETLYSLVDSSNMISDDLWDAVTTITNSKNESKMIVFLPKAVENIKEPYDKVFRYQFFSFDFIKKMTKLKSNGLSDALMKQVQQVILRYIVQFPNSTNLIVCIFRLIKYGIIWDEFSDQFIENFIPIMIIEATNNNKTAVQANSKRLLWRFNTRSKYKSLRSKINKKVDNFKEFCSSVLNKYDQIITSSYGGDSQYLGKQSLFSTNFFVL